MKSKPQITLGFCIASPQQGDLRLSGPPSGQDTSGVAQTHDTWVLADLRVDLLATVPPTPPTICGPYETNNTAKMR
ncbi:hypothetical protein PoB_003937800 [Plakobranchus ocellatus]|uniref:Uncharacterized protein n=1 Tax=Plakobranchus ocellatus TaxID=259542 RepID=A0AAV4B1A7_9GAST|nr:hypothetical protein PoB_003937800 [Plakobranchus ocellatus]